MDKNYKIELSKFELLVLTLSRKIKITTKILIKSKFARILILVFILIFVLVGALFFIKSFNYISKGDVLYKNVKYELSLEKYELANRWWIFDRINPKLQNNSLLIKIRKAQIMVKSTEYYEQGKKDFEEGRYANAKLNLNNMAENDPRNSEVKNILLKIDEIETIVKVDENKSIMSISSPNEPIILDEPVVPVLAPEPEPVPIVYLNLNKPYISKNNMTVTVTSIEKIEETNSYEYTISYKQENKIIDKELEEGTFKIFFDDNTGLNQYGFFDKLFPGESKSRTYTFEYLKEQKPFVIEFNDHNDTGFFRNQPAVDTLKWRVD